MESAAAAGYNRDTGCFQTSRNRRGEPPDRQKGVWAMIPCQQTCSSYCEGCHKSCARWADFQQQKSRERQAKKDYLKYYNELCGAVARQFRAIGAVYMTR